MRFVSKLALAAMFTAALSLMNPAMAGCRRMGFTVNDYGLEGPKRDAQNLLDKHISEWAAEQGIEKFNVGKKDVSCELYLNLIVFDEHTCTATATVCWGDSINRASSQSASTKKPAPIKKEAATSAKSSEASTPAKDEAKAAASSEDDAAEKTAAADDKADETKAAEADTGESSEVETGALPVPSTAAETAAAVSPLAVEATTTADTSTDSNTSADSAAAAAEAAAAAAERAASAAERAAKAAERAAAAVADLPKPAASAPAASEPAASSSSSGAAATGSPVAPVTSSP